MSSAGAGYAHADAVARLLRGYHLGWMPERHDTSSSELEGRQDQKVREEARFARDADQPAESRAHQRRADKAAYLRDKLAEADRADREAASDA